jgi:magnesium transporter
MAAPAAAFAAMLINCVAYKQGHKLADITVEAISDYVEQPDCFVWVALRDATDAELAEMKEEFSLHELAVEDAHHGHQRPKIEEYGDTLFAVMHLPEVEPDGSLRVGELAVFVGRNFVLSVRNRSHRSLLNVRERAQRQPELLAHGSGFVFYALMDAVVDSYFPLLDALETQLEVIEDQIFERGAARLNVQQLYALKRKATTLRHAVMPLLDAIGKLYGGRVPMVCSGVQHYFRDVADHLARIATSIDAIRETIATAIQVNLSMVTIEESEVNKRLAAWAGIFAVATAFAGIWGMNFEVMPELQWRWGYPVALGAIAGACVLLYRRFRKAGWL